MPDGLPAIGSTVSRAKIVSLKSRLSASKVSSKEIPNRVRGEILEAVEKDLGKPVTEIKFGESIAKLSRRSGSGAISIGFPLDISLYCEAKNVEIRMHQQRRIPFVRPAAAAHLPKFMYR